MMAGTPAALCVSICRRKVHKTENVLLAMITVEMLHFVNALQKRTSLTSAVGVRKNDIVFFLN